MASLVQQFREAPVLRVDWSDTGVQSTTERYMMFVLLPLWIVPGLLDWYWHKQTDIENTSGLKESLIHSVMMLEVGVPIELGLIFEINPLVLSFMAAAVVVHSATAIWDVSLAVHHREVRTREQHTHSFLEVLPFMGAAFAACLHGDATWRLLSGRTEPDDWRLKIKQPRLSVPYLATIAGLIVVGVGWPYANEAWRCVRRLRAAKHNTGFYREDSDARNC